MSTFHFRMQKTLFLPLRINSVDLDVKSKHANVWSLCDKCFWKSFHTGYAIILCRWGVWRARSNLNPVKQLDLGQILPILPGCKTAWRGIVAWDTGAIKYPSFKACRAVFFFFFCVCVCVWVCLAGWVNRVVLVCSSWVTILWNASLFSARIMISLFYRSEDAVQTVIDFGLSLWLMSCFFSFFLI